MATRPLPNARAVWITAAAAVALAAVASTTHGATVGFVPVDAALAASSTADVGLSITEDRGRFRFTFTNPADLGSSHLKVAFEAGLTDLLGQPLRVEADGATFADRTAIMPRQPGRLHPAGWQGAGTLLAAQELDPARGLRNTDNDALSVSFLKRGLSMEELIDALATVGHRIGVVTHWGAGHRLAMITAMPAPAPPVEPLEPPVGPVPLPIPTPAAAALGLALLATQCTRRRP